MIETLIVPGLNGSPEGHWQRHWADFDPEAELVEQEDWARPRLTDWLHTLEARIEASPPGVILVAHSLGCALVGILAGRPAAAHVGGALLVAPADLSTLCETHSTVRDFADAEASARGEVLPFASILVASRNDPYLSYAGAIRLAARWGSALIDLGHAGHVNIASGYGRWDESRRIADGLRGRISHAGPAGGGWHATAPGATVGADRRTA